MIKLKFTILMLFFLIAKVQSQNITSLEDIFKMNLFLDKKNIMRSDLELSIIKNDSLYELFSKNSILNIDTLDLKSDLYLPINSQFKFYLLKDIRFKSELEKKMFWVLNIKMCENSRYIIAFNEYTGQSFKLSGFSTNDFMSFFSIIKSDYRSLNFKKLRKTIFFKKYKVQFLDFECIFKSLKNGDEFSSCLNTCEDVLKLH